MAYNEARNRAVRREAVVLVEMGRERRKNLLLPHPHYLSTCGVCHYRAICQQIPRAAQVYRALIDLCAKTPRALFVQGSQNPPLDYMPIYPILTL
jgi:hypothetical protein